jgi:hypothetical protein
VPDAGKLDFTGAGSYVIAHYLAQVRVVADTTVTVSPGSRIMDDTGAILVNGVQVATASAGTSSLAFTLGAGTPLSFW